MASYVFVLFLCDFFDVSLSASMRVRIWTHRYFFTVIIFSSMVKEYEFRLSAATGCFRHGVSLHTSIVVNVDRGPHDSFLQPNRVHKHVERVITIFLCTWTVFIRRHLGGQPRAHFDIARMQRPTTIHHLA